jgi:hypothetical protein
LDSQKKRKKDFPKNRLWVSTHGNVFQTFQFQQFIGNLLVSASNYNLDPHCLPIGNSMLEIMHIGRVNNVDVYGFQCLESNFVANSILLYTSKILLMISPLLNSIINSLPFDLFPFSKTVLIFSAISFLSNPVTKQLYD